MYIAIITARGGSKRIPRKNIRNFMGKPMIAWSIEAAKKSGVFEHIFVSTDDQEIADVAITYDATVPFLRPASQADDYTLAHVPVLHMLKWAQETYGDIPAFAHIYPTAPMLKPEWICEGARMIQAGKKYVYTAQKISYPIYQVVHLDENGEIVKFFPKEQYVMRSQDMPQAYIDAGQLYWFNSAAFLEHEIFIPSGTGVIAIPPEMALDIDTEEDWVLAEKFARYFADNS